MTIRELRERLAALADAEAILPARVVLGWLPITEAEPYTRDALVDLTVDEAGSALGRSASTLRQWCRDGLLPGAYRLRGRQWRVPCASIVAFQQKEAGARVNENARATPQQRDEGPVDLGSWRKVRRAVR